LPNIFLEKKEELETLKGELNDSRQQLQLVEQVSFGEICIYCPGVSRLLHRNEGSHFSQQLPAHHLLFIGARWLKIGHLQS